jgi:hypothetical protein
MAISIPTTAPPSNAALTPPPDLETMDATGPPAPSSVVLDESDLQLKLENFLQAPPSPAHQDTLPFPHGLQLPKSLYGDSNIPDFSIPDADEGSSDMDPFLGSNGDCDPFLGHDGMAGMLSMSASHQLPTKTFEFAGSWPEGGVEDMSKILDGFDLSFDDVIQVLETEIN